MTTTNANPVPPADDDPELLAALAELHSMKTSPPTDTPAQREKRELLFRGLRERGPVGLADDILSVLDEADEW